MNSVSFSRRPVFWFLLAGIFFAGCAVSFKYFSRVFPFINIEITMNRTEALKAARTFAEKHNIGPKDCQQAGLFDDDEKTQTYIELAGGGKKAFAQILEERYFCPYKWHIRHFKQGDPNELHVSFSPEGTPYGFEEKLSEDSPGAALTQAKAQAIAVKQARDAWSTDFSTLTLAESSQETRPSNRIDHTFVYERTDKKVGDAPYRLKLVVSGDRLTQYELSIKVPESFKRRYEEMRSANNTIASVASILMVLLYVFGGCVIALFLLLRRRWLLWHKALMWGGFIAFLQLLNGINSLPMYWMHYNTQITQATFLINFFFMLVLHCFAYTGILALIFAAAEGLGRKAFPEHPQLWQLWSKLGAASIQVLGRTIGGYLVVGLHFAFVLGFYYLAFRYFGWWMPSENLINPNVISYYLPWLGSIAQALQAGFMEECLFRAVPLSCAALIGEKKGNKRLWLVAGMVLQALIFSAAHANYPAQPSYARLIELLVPSCIFGGLYLRFGLLPGIISHFIYDVVWMALPLFCTTAPGIWIDKTLVIACSLVPLGVVFIARTLLRGWSELPSKLYNYAWKPPQPTPSAEAPEKKILTDLSNKTSRALGVVGCAGLLLWLCLTQFKQDGLSINTTKQQAIAAAQKGLQAKGVALDQSWKIIPHLERVAVEDFDRFVWQTAGRTLYQKLLGTYVKPAQWKIRFAQFDSKDLIERAEEYNLSIAPDGTLARYDHQLPESRPGKTLTEKQARVIAHNVLKKEYQLNPASLKEISAVSTKQPERLDWVFTFSDPATYPKQATPSHQGEARIAVKLAGDQVVDHTRFIFVPEQWRRTDQQQQIVFKILALLCIVVLLFFLMLGGAQAILQWSQHHFATRVFLLFFCLLGIKSLLQVINLWSVFPAVFKTSEPYWNQSLMLVGSFLVQIIFKAGSFGLLAGFMTKASFRNYTKHTLAQRTLCGASLGALIAGIESLCTRISPSLKPLWAEYIHAPVLSPSLSYALTLFTTYVYVTVLLYMVFWATNQVCSGWQKNKVLGSILFLLMGIALVGASGIEHLLSWVCSGLAIGVLLACSYIFVIRFDRKIIPLVSGSYVALEALQQAWFRAYPGALSGALFAMVLILGFAAWWSDRLIENDA